LSVLSRLKEYIDKFVDNSLNQSNSMNIKGKAICDRGLIRTGNEDHILVDDHIFTDGAMNFELVTGEVNHWFAVADGMGGHLGGEEASRLVLESFREISSGIPADVGLKEFDGQLIAWLMEINLRLKQEGEQAPQFKGMGTTLAGVFIGETDIFLFNAGDSRVYLFNYGELTRLTHDHTLAETAGRRDVRSHLLVNCIGPINHPYIDIDNITREIKPGATLLICSDGLSDMIDETEILTCCEAGSADLLVKKACDAGGRDNISVILMQFS